MKALLFTLLYTLLVAATPAFASGASVKITIDLMGAEASLCDDIAYPLTGMVAKSFIPNGADSTETILVIKNGSIRTDGCQIDTHMTINDSRIHNTRKHGSGSQHNGDTLSAHFYRLNLVDIDLHIEAGDYVSAFYSTGIVLTADDHTRRLQKYKSWWSAWGFSWNSDNSSAPTFDESK